MELVFNDQSIQLRKQLSVEEVIKKINELLGSNYYFSHVIIDRIAVYDDLEQYLAERMDWIGRLEVVAQTMSEFRNDILLTAEEYLKRAETELPRLADCFYQNSESGHWAIFDDMLEGIQWLNQIISSIDRMEDKPNNWGEYKKIVTALEMQLQALEEAVENIDTVLIADIIKYELINLYQSLGNEIQSTIDTEGMRDNVN